MNISEEQKHKFYNLMQKDAQKKKYFNEYMREYRRKKIHGYTRTNSNIKK